MKEEYWHQPQFEDLAFSAKIWSLRELLPSHSEPEILVPSTIHESLRLINDGYDLLNCKIPMNDEDNSVFSSTNLYRQITETDLFFNTSAEIFTSIEPSDYSNQKSSKKTNSQKENSPSNLGVRPKNRRITKKLPYEK